jgi:hypothetical protein
VLLVDVEEEFEKALGALSLKKLRTDVSREGMER